MCCEDILNDVIAQRQPQFHERPRKLEITARRSGQEKKKREFLEVRLLKGVPGGGGEVQRRGVWRRRGPAEGPSGKKHGKQTPAPKKHTKKRRKKKENTQTSKKIGKIQKQKLARLLAPSTPPPPKQANEPSARSLARSHARLPLPSKRTNCPLARSLAHPSPPSLPFTRQANGPARSLARSPPLPPERASDRPTWRSYCQTQTSGWRFRSRTST